MKIRQQTVSFMRQHQEDFEPYMEDDEPFDRYCKRMAEVCMHGLCFRSLTLCQVPLLSRSCVSRQEGTWAGQQEQVAVARHFGVVIHVYQAGQPLWSIRPGFPDFPQVHSMQPCTPPWFLPLNLLPLICCACVAQPTWPNNHVAGAGPRRHTPELP